MKIIMIAILAICTLSGCNKSNQSETSPVSGKVLLDGKPLTTGTVTFMPQRGRVASGEIQSDGGFQLHTYGEADGAIIGVHKVAVRSITTNKKVLDENNPNMKALIPTKYFSPEESGLEYEVKKGQENVYTIELKSK